MTSSPPSELQCWRAARPCPMVDTSTEQRMTCRAWFRCEVAGDYVIRWRCQAGQDGELSLTNASALYNLCQDQFDASDMAECPPPIVCADESLREASSITSSALSSDVILTIAVACFALLAMILIIVSSYKYWTLRKRLRLRLKPQHYVIRDFPYPVRYHSLWGTGYQHQGQEHQQARQTPYTRSYGSPYPDVYFSRPQDSSRFFERLLASSDSSLENNTGDHWRPPRAQTGHKSRRTDPTVATGSFVYHQPLGHGGGDGDKNHGRTEHWVHHNSQAKNDSDSEKSVECYHIYRGNLSKFRTHEHHYASGNVGTYRGEYHHLINASTDFTKAPRLSSIAIPSFDFSSLHKSKCHYDPRKQEHQAREHNADQLYTQQSFDSDISQASHFAAGQLIPGSSQRTYNIGQEDLRQDHHIYSVPGKDTKGNNPSSSHPKGSNLDVISSHNFTNRFVRMGKNIYRPLLTTSASASSLTMGNNNNNNNNNNSKRNNNVDLSYDSFRNEHLRELAKEGAASSSTLEAGYRHKSQEKVQTLNTRH